MAMPYNVKVDLPLCYSLLFLASSKCTLDLLARGLREMRKEWRAEAVLRTIYILLTNIILPLAPAIFWPSGHEEKVDRFGDIKTRTYIGGQVNKILAGYNSTRSWAPSYIIFIA